MFVGQPSRDRKPQTRSPLFLAGREKGLENPVPHRRGDSRAGVLNVDGHAFAMLQEFRPDGEKRTFPNRNGLARVDDEVCDDLFQFGEMTLDEGKLRRQMDRVLDKGFSNLGSDDVQVFLTTSLTWICLPGPPRRPSWKSPSGRRRPG
jgi:hypothetical protein